MILSRTLIFICLVPFFFSCAEEDYLEPTKKPSYQVCETRGVIHDYTGLDGCGFVIELADSSKLEPTIVDDTNFVFEDGKEISLTYTELTGYGSICMVGKLVHITCISDFACPPVSDFGLIFDPEDYPNDAVIINEVEIMGDCLCVNVSYGGGCEDHEFSMGVVWPECGTPPVPPPALYLCHNANNDMCEAYITETVCFDLSLLKVAGQYSSTFSLRPNFLPSSYWAEFTYHY